MCERKNNENMSAERARERGRESREVEKLGRCRAFSIVSEVKYLFCVQSAYAHRCAKKAVPSYCRTSNVHSPFLLCAMKREKWASYVFANVSALYVPLFLFLFLSNTYICMCRAHFAYTSSFGHTMRNIFFFNKKNRFFI